MAVIVENYTWKPLTRGWVFCGFGFTAGPDLEWGQTQRQQVTEPEQHTHAVVKQEREVDPELDPGEDGSAVHLQSLRTTATKLFQLNQAGRQLHSCLSAALQGDSWFAHSQAL